MNKYVSKPTNKNLMNEQKEGRKRFARRRLQVHAVEIHLARTYRSLRLLESASFTANRNQNTKARFASEREERWGKGREERERERSISISTCSFAIGDAEEKSNGWFMDDFDEIVGTLNKEEG